MTDLQHFRIEFARVSNVMLSHEMRDADRRDYWRDVLEPAWEKLKLSWHVEEGIPRDEWEAAIRSVLAEVRTPSQWRAVKWRKKADTKALRIVTHRKEARRKRQDDGQKDRTFTATTKAFWQEQKFGPASPVRHIDPATYKIED